MTNRLTKTSRAVFLYNQPIFNSLVDAHSVVSAGWQESDDESTIYVGEGGCCNGHLYRLTKSKQKPVIDAIVNLPFGPEDILPVVLWNNSRAPVLVVGSACDGAGVRIVNTLHPFSVGEVMGGKKYGELRTFPKAYIPSTPRFRVDQSTETIHVDMLRGVYWRNTDRYFVSSEVLARMDITPRLREVGVDVGATMKLVANYHPLPYGRDS